MTLTPEKIAELRRLEKRATFGPWRWNGGGKVRVETGKPNPPIVVTGMGPVNAELISVMRNALPALLDAAEERLSQQAHLTEVVQAAEEMYAEIWGDDWDAREDPETSDPAVQWRRLKKERDTLQNKLDYTAKAAVDFEFEMCEAKTERDRLAGEVERLHGAFDKMLSWVRKWHGDYLPCKLKTIFKEAPKEGGGDE